MSSQIIWRSFLILPRSRRVYLGHHDETAAAYQHINDVNPGDGPAYLQLLQFLFDHRMFEDLAEVGNKVVPPPLEPRDEFRALNLLVIAYTETGAYEQAIAHADRALAYNPTRIALWERKTRLYAKLHRPAEALQCLQQTCSIKPKAKKYQDMASKYAAKHHLD